MPWQLKIWRTFRTDKLIDSLMMYTINNGVITRFVLVVEALFLQLTRSVFSIADIISLILVRGIFLELAVLHDELTLATRFSLTQRIYIRWPCLRS